MKFEKPIAEIQRFSVEDVISSSGETSHEFNPEPGTTAAALDQECSGRHTDNYNFDFCL